MYTSLFRVEFEPSFHDTAERFMPSSRALSQKRKSVLFGASDDLVQKLYTITMGASPPLMYHLHHQSIDMSTGKAVASLVSRKGISALFSPPMGMLRPPDDARIQTKQSRSRNSLTVKASATMQCLIFLSMAYRVLVLCGLKGGSEEEI